MTDGSPPASCPIFYYSRPQCQYYQLDPAFFDQELLSWIYIYTESSSLREEGSLLGAAVIIHSPTRYTHRRASGHDESHTITSSSASAHLCSAGSSKAHGGLLHVHHSSSLQQSKSVFIPALTPRACSTTTISRSCS